MKKRLSFLMLMLTMGICRLMAQSAFADLYIPDTNVDEGTTSVVLNVNMKNSTDACDCFEALVSLPDGFSITKVARGSRIKGMDDDDEYLFVFANSDKTEGKYIQCYTTKGARISGTDGDVAKITVSIPAGAKAGSYDIKLQGVECGDGAAAAIRSTYTEITSKLTIGDNGNVTLNSCGYSTYSSIYERSVPADVTAYTGTVDEDGKVVTWTVIADGIIPANEGVLLKGTANASVTLAASSTEKAKIAGNALKPNLSERAKSAIGEYVYVLSGESVIRLSDSGTLAANKAYFNLSKYITNAASAAKMLSFDWDDATAINAISSNGMEKTAYNLQGQRVKSDSKGIVITDGKKKLVK